MRALVIFLIIVFTMWVVMISPFVIGKVSQLMKQRTKKTVVEVRPAPPAHVDYTALMSVLDDLIRAEWGYNQASFTMNSLDRGIGFEVEVKRITASVMNSVSDSMTSDLCYYVKKGYIMVYVTRSVTSLLTNYIEERVIQMNKQSNAIRMKK